MDGLILIPIILPMAGGLLLLADSFREHLRGSGEGDKAAGQGKIPGKPGKSLYVYVTVILIISAASALGLAWTGDRSITLFTLLEDIPIYFHIDALGRWFVTVVSIVWVAAGIFAFSYMAGEGEEKRYFGFYLVLYGVLTALDFSGNLVTMYLFYELTTLVSMPLVMHNGTREATMAALKYLFYSLCGAYGGLFGIFFLNRYCTSLDFMPGGTLDMTAAGGQEEILLIAVFVMLLGFGAKAGMLPLHGWLPTAHPVAPSPASAVLSSVIVKAGVLAIIRSVYYIAGPAFLRGTWVQYAWISLALITVFMGSMLAYRQQVLKKRLAYSTVSQVSYILFGLALLTPSGMEGALLHVAVHAVIKCGLFLTAGVFLHQYGITRVEELRGAGRKIPGVMWCYTLFSLGLVGIPPLGGFISKWYLAVGALQSGMGMFTWLGPVVLLVSALLTAGYLLPIAMKGFFPGKEEPNGSTDSAGITENAESAENTQSTVNAGNIRRGDKVSPAMLLPLMALAALALLMGLFPNPLTEYVSDIAF